MESNRRIEYVDEADALRRLAGNESIYKLLLRKFRDGDHLAPIENAISAGNALDAERAAHALKGLSANLSLPKIYELSLQIEQHCKQNTLIGLPLAELKDALSVTNGIVSEIIGEAI